MKITLNRVDQAFHFEGKGASDIAIHIDGSEDIGGSNLGARPMELILMGLGSCGAMDVVSILKKQKQEILDLKIHIEGKRNYDITPAVFEEINVEFLFYGNLKEEKVEKALKLSMEKYCSVSAMLSKTALIKYSYEIIKTN